VAGDGCHGGWARGGVCGVWLVLAALWYHRWPLLWQCGVVLGEDVCDEEGTQAGLPMNVDVPAFW
jgi:hypothetical protein